MPKCTFCHSLAHVQVSRIAPKTHTKLVGEAQVCLLDAPSPTQPILRTRRGCGADCRLLSVIVSYTILTFTHIMLPHSVCKLGP